MATTLSTGLSANPMALYTTSPSYDTLIEVLQVYLNRYDEDTINAMPMFINIAEKTILRQIRMPSIEKMVKFNLLEDGMEAEGWVPMPSDCLEMKFVWVEGAGGRTLGRVTFDRLLAMKYDNYHGENVYFNNYNDEAHCGSGSSSDSTSNDLNSSTPRAWAINGDRLYLHPAPILKDMYMTYYADIEELSETNPTNVLLDLMPDVILYYAVGEGFRFLMEMDKGDYWENVATKRLAIIRDQVNQAEYSGSPLTVVPM